MPTKPIRVVNGEVPQTGQRNSHSEAAPCASQNAMPGNAATIPQRLTGQNSHRGVVTNTSMVQPVNSHDFR